MCPPCARPHHSPAFQAAPSLLPSVSPFVLCSFHPLLLFLIKFCPRPCAGGAFKHTRVCTHTVTHTIRRPHFLSSLSSFPFFSWGLQKSFGLHGEKQEHTNRDRGGTARGGGMDGRLGVGKGCLSSFLLLLSPASPALLRSSHPVPRAVLPSDCDPGDTGSVSPARLCLCFHPCLAPLLFPLCCGLIKCPSLSLIARPQGRLCVCGCVSVPAGHFPPPVPTSLRLGSISSSFSFWPFLLPSWCACIGEQHSVCPRTSHPSPFPFPRAPGTWPLGCLSAHSSSWPLSLPPALASRPSSWVVSLVTVPWTPYPQPRKLNSSSVIPTHHPASSTGPPVLGGSAVTHPHPPAAFHFLTPSPGPAHILCLWWRKPPLPHLLFQAFPVWTQLPMAP